MNTKTARRFLKFMHPDQLSSPEVRKALASAGNDADWKAEFDLQTQTDTPVADACGEICLQPGEFESLVSTRELFTEKGRKIHLSLRDPTVLGVVFAVLLLVGFFFWFLLGSLDRIHGEEKLLDLVKAGATEEIQQFDEVDSTLGELDDWFTMNGVSRLWIPEKFLPEKVLAVRTFNYRGNQVASALLPRQQMLVYIFQGKPLGIEAPDENKWYYAKSPKESVALIERNGVCFVVVIRGKIPELKQALQ
ncbi:MAG: hypothetical protein ACK5NG_07790 [Chthoniobacterales bacterium]